MSTHRITQPWLSPKPYCFAPSYFHPKTGKPLNDWQDDTFHNGGNIYSDINAVAALPFQGKDK